MPAERMLPTAEDKQLVALTRDIVAAELAPVASEYEAESRFPREKFRLLGKSGLLGLPYPERWGGSGVSYEVYLQVLEEIAAAWMTVAVGMSVHTLSCFPLAYYGTDEQRDEWLPGLLAGDLLGAYALSEPDAGSDAAALSARAVRDGDEYVVDGQKVFTTGAHAADYVWLACRTAPSRHKGITILIADTRDPGFSWTPIITHDGAHHVNATYYSGVRVPARMRVGGENEGWRLITSQLNHERVMLGPAGRIAALHDWVRAWAADHALLAEPDVRRALAQTAAVMRVNELLSWQIASAPALDVADASAVKVFSSEQLQVLGPALAELVGRHGDPADPDTAALVTWLDIQLKRNTVLTFGGGVNEIQRELIATAGLALPRSPR